MNILYITHLSYSTCAGPTYSVPAQIEAQSKIDNVFWFNISNSPLAKVWKDFRYYHDSDEFPEQKISLLPPPFNKPDIVVVEQFYDMAKCPIRRELVKNFFPYVIIPRGELTKGAQHRKWLKKFIANKIIFENFAKNALAIHYLTEQERKTSGSKWNKNSYIIPNGVNLPDNLGSRIISNVGLRFVSIGRIEPYQKGLDLLVEACAQVQKELRDNRATVNLYGPDVDGKVDALKKMICLKGVSDIISIHGSVLGKEKIDVLKKNDVFVMTSRFEGHPMALIEAMSFSMPCLVTEGTNMADEVKKFDAGWSAENTVNSIKDAFIRILNEKNFIDKSINARNLAGNFAWNSIAIASHNEYEQLLKKYH